MNKVFLFLFLFSAPNLFGAYQVKIAVYKDHANLMTNISKIPGENYRKNILVKEKNHLHYATSGVYESEEEVKKALTAYKKVFSDAFISEVKQKKTVTVSAVAVKQKIIVPISIQTAAKTLEPIKNEQPTALDAFIVSGIQKNVDPEPTEVVANTPEPIENNQSIVLDAASQEVKQKKAVVVSSEAVKEESAVPVSTETVAKIPEPIKYEQRIRLDAKMLLENKTVYICDEDESIGAKKEVVKMDFKQDYVVYSKLKRDIPPVHIPYTFKEDCVILPMSGINFKYQFYHEDQDFLSAQGFIEDKKGQKSRYYFDEELALEFVRQQ